tara:strand:- start:67 stop:1050 length:984 start_codon:yes stop_codon:yes gene_type:complete
MILKLFELGKIDLNSSKHILFYGKNNGAKEEKIDEILENNKETTVIKYDEKEILDNNDPFFNEILSESLFANNKIILVSRITDKFTKIIEKILDKKTSDVLIILNSGNLEKKSKLRSLFEKSKNLICCAFYPDTQETLSRFTINFFKKINIPISQSNINLLINRCSGDRGVLKKELEKISLFVQNNKKITTENLLKLTNLIENYDISELIDNCLAKNQKKTVDILNENNFNNEDCTIITRIFLNKSKRLLNLKKEFETNNNLEKTLTTARPPIFWKDKGIVKQQLIKWTVDQVKNLIYDITKIEIQIKKNNSNSLNILSDFILEKVS